MLEMAFKLIADGCKGIGPVEVGSGGRHVPEEGNVLTKAIS